MDNPDLVVYNGVIYPRPEIGSRVDAIAVRDGKVASTGSSRDILNFRSTSTKTLDLKRRVVLPGLADSHVHLLGLGMLMRTLDLSKARAILDVQKMLAKAASNKPRDVWIIGRGWDQEKLEDRRYPNRSDTDIIPNPVFLRRVCGHVAVANSPALTASGVNESTLDPVGGEIVRDSDGKPDGILKERALELVSRSIPRDESETEQALLVAAERLLANGVTALHCIIETAHEFNMIRRLKKKGKIAQTIFAILPLSMLNQIRSLEDKPGVWSDGFKIGGLKIFLDGSLGARTAALGIPYNDDPGSFGMLTTPKEQLLELIEKTRNLQIQLCLHAIGDKAVEMAIKTLGETLGERDCRGSRHRIEHASLISRDLLHEMGRLGLVASVQPRFIYSDSWAEKRLGTKRLQYLYPFKSMLRAGIHVAAGSDSPSDDPSAMEGLWSAVDRPGLPATERLTTSEAISCYTTGAAYASFSENYEGTLEPGKWANMIVLDRDPFTCTPQELRAIKVLQTIVHGKQFRWN